MEDGVKRVWIVPTEIRLFFGTTNFAKLCKIMKVTVHRIVDIGISIDIANRRLSQRYKYQ